MNIFQLVFYNIYSLIICFRIFPFLVAVRRPVLIHPCVRVKKIHRGGIVLKNDTARLIIGFNGTIGQSNCQSILSISETGKLIISGLTTLAKGSRLIIDNGNVAKSTEVASECVVVQGTLVTGKFSEEHCLIGGVPAKIIKRGYSWKA